MAKANWLNVDKTSGSGNGRVNATTPSPHTGRTARTTTLTFKAINTPNETSEINQAGKPQFVDIAESASAPKEGKTVTITGVSNSAKLTFSLGAGDLNISLPSSYTANSMDIQNGADIPGDPGASAEYPFSITITVPANETIESQSRQIIVIDESGNEDACVLTLIAGDPYLRLSSNYVEMDWQGNPVTIDVFSNTNWTVE